MKGGHLLISADVEGADNKVTIFVSFTSLMAIGGVGWGILCLLDGLRVAAIIPLAYSAISIPAIYIGLKHRKHVAKVMHFVLLMSLLLPFMLQWALGGFAASGAVMLWAWSALIGALLIVNRRPAFIYFLTYLGLTVSSAYIDTFLRVNHSEISLEQGYVFGINIFAVSAMLFVVFFVFVQKIASHNRIMDERLQALRLELTQAHEATLRAARLATIGELAAGVGHEINNPLSIIIGNVDLLKRECAQIIEGNPKTEARFKKIYMANQRIRGIVDGLRTYARMDTAKLETISITEAIEQALNLVAEILAKDGVTLTRSILESDLYVVGSIGKMQQVLVNLVTNAKDATEGQEVRKITCTLQKQGEDKIQLSVSDNGGGMSDEIKSKIFNPFFTTKDVGKGTGMGLGIVAGIISDFGGTIKVESQPGKGSTFTITLPSVKPEASAPVMPINTDNQISGFTFPARVLIVDDESAIREMLQEMVIAHGAKHVTVAGDGEEALKKIMASRYDLVFTDLQMPRMDGVTLIREIRKLPQSQSPLVIVMSGGVVVDPNYPPGGELAGLVNGYINKPFDSNQIREIVATYYKKAA